VLPDTLTEFKRLLGGGKKGKWKERRGKERKGEERRGKKGT